MRLASCRLGDRQFVAVIEGDEAIPLDGLLELGSATPLALLRRLPKASGPAAKLADVELRAVVPRPGKIICVGRNYREHVEEGLADEEPSHPVLFTKFREALIGPYAAIEKPPESDQVDYEAELAVVIGESLRRVSEENALEAIAGYTVANDVTMRDYQLSTSQWLPGKSWARSTPLGPFLVTPDGIGNPELDIRLELNGLEMQASNTGRLIFGIPALISYVSRFVPLEPGDVMLTGTPAGVGYHRDPQVFLAAGDRVRVEIEGLGAIDNTVVEERP